MVPRRFFLEGAPAVRERLLAARWESTQRWELDLYWRRQVPSLPFFRQLPRGARINHIPGIGALTSPRRLAETLARQSRLLAGPGATIGPALLAPDADGGAARTLTALVLIASVDPLRLHLREDAALDEASSAAREALRRLVVSTVAAGYDDLVRAARDHLAERAAPFELLRFDVRFDGESVGLIRCVLSPPIDDAVAAEVLSLLDLAPNASTASPAPTASNTQFRQLVPSERSSAFLAACPLPRWSDLLLAGIEADDIAIELRAASRILDGAIVLFQEETARFHVLNDTAGYIWVRLRDGRAPDAIAAEIAEQFGVDPEVARGDVWDALARWATDGWVGRCRSPGAGAESAGTGTSTSSSSTRSGSTRSGSTAQASGHDAGSARCLLAASGAVIAPAAGDAVVLVGSEPSGVSAIAAVMSLRGEARVVADATWVEEATGRAIVAPARLAVFESDDGAVAALSLAFAASPHSVAANEVGVRFHEPPPWVGEPPVVGPIVVVRRAARGAETALRPLRPRDLLLELVALGMRAEPAWSTARAMSLLEWLAETPGFELSASDVESGANALSESINQFQS